MSELKLRPLKSNRAEAPTPWIESSWRLNRIIQSSWSSHLLIGGLDIAGRAKAQRLHLWSSTGGFSFFLLLLFSCGL
jgi:hypothetical protein